MATLTMIVANGLRGKGGRSYRLQDFMLEPVKRKIMTPEQMRDKIIEMHRVFTAIGDENG